MFENNPYMQGYPYFNGAYSQPQFRQQQSQQPPTNVNWIQVNGIDGARNITVQPGNTIWAMDNNEPVFYVKSADSMGVASLKAYRFTEIQPGETAKSEEYVTRKEFNDLLKRLGENPEEVANG
ncbi:MAG: hypothetical protein ACI3XQ_06450 [Eubacteriales bacterium]